ncbi:MbtH family NRPS accessory protein [Neisseriaceae bacterium PsAf]|nr:MbtH family NRPS accessory protein [Neisseriaceae bacterium PsAf]MCV2504065.1 MbtH family protein [Neisseriaceae bacterium]
MMENPFDNEQGTFHVLINKEEQYSLWPTFCKIPQGWDVVLENKDRETCLNYVKENWTDMRPKSLKEAMNNLET